MHTLSQQRGVLIRGVLGRLGGSSLQCDAVSLVLHSLRGDESLDFGGLGIGFGAFFLGGDFAANDELAVDNRLALLCFGALVSEKHTERRLAWSSQRIVESWWHAWDLGAWG